MIRTYSWGPWISGTIKLDSILSLTKCVAIWIFSSHFECVSSCDFTTSCVYYPFTYKVHFVHQKNRFAFAKEFWIMPNPFRFAMPSTLLCNLILAFGDGMDTPLWGKSLIKRKKPLKLSLEMWDTETDLPTSIILMIVWCVCPESGLEKKTLPSYFFAD